MQEIIRETTPDLHSLIGNGCVNYLRDQMLSVAISFDCWETRVRIIDITHALKHGKTCDVLTLIFSNVAHNDGAGLSDAQEYLLPYGSDFRRLLADLLNLSWVKGRFGFDAITSDRRKIYRDSERSVRVYSPFATLAPLTSAPAKWTVSHVVRALWNGQFEDLKCDYRLSDDYAHDNAVNFCKGSINNARAFCRRLITSPSGWWASAHGNGVSICCHSFDSNSFKLKLG